MSDMDTGEKLKYLREINSYTQCQLAQYLDLTENEYFSMEDNNYPINLTLLKKLCALYYISPEFLSSNSSNYSPPKLAFKVDNVNLEVIGRINQTMQYVEMLKNIDDGD